MVKIYYILLSIVVKHFHNAITFQSLYSGQRVVEKKIMTEDGIITLFNVIYHFHWWSISQGSQILDDDSLKNMNSWTKWNH